MNTADPNSFMFVDCNPVDDLQSREHVQLPRRKARVMREYQRQVRVKRIQAVIARLNPASGQRKGSIERSIQKRAESPAMDQQQVDSRDPTLLSSIHTALGAGRLDPFDVYPFQNLPIYVHEILDHGESLPL